MKQSQINPELMNTELIVTTVQELSLAREINEVMKIVRSVARKLTEADGSTFVLRDGDLCFYADEDAISPLWKGSRFPINTCISGWAMLNKQPAVIEDIYQDDRIPIDVYRPTFVKSLVTVPIRTKDPIGAIGNYWAKQRMPSPREVSLLQALADITAVSIENIGVRDKLEEKLQERDNMLIQLKEQQKQLQEFTQIIAHNVRAPLSNLMVLNDMIRNTKDVDDIMLCCEKQQPVIDFLHQTFEELVSATQVKADFSVEKDHIELEETISKTISLLQGEIQKANATITWDFSKAKTIYYPTKYADSIIFNLLSNAIKYRSLGRDLQIKISSYKKSGWVYLEVSDNGLGIDLQKHGDKVFKLHKTFHEHPEAKGFGLFITKTQIKAMGGSININSNPDKGTRFTIKLSKEKTI